MPEGPEIRRAAMRLDKVLHGQLLDEVYFGQSHLQRHAQLLEGTRVAFVTSRSKAILTHFDNDLSLYSHNQLYGRWYITRRHRWPTTNRTLRVALHTRDHSALLYSASDIELLDPPGVAAHPYLQRLGPDALDASVTWRDVAARLRDPQFKRRALAALYLDQGFVAGIGNYLRSEILFTAGVEPSRKAQSLSRGQVGGLARATLDITRRALATAGVTNPSTRVKALQKQGLKREAYRFAVFGRDQQPCYVCGSAIRRITMSSRRLYYCPSCQS
ncbi:MAG: endonuclease VIII [Pseudomonadota bacterium]